MIEWFDDHPGIDVTDSEFVRLLGYPGGHVLEGRALELANDTRTWFRQHGSAFLYAREARSLEITDQAVSIEGQME